MRKSIVSYFVGAFMLSSLGSAFACEEIDAGTVVVCHECTTEADIADALRLAFPNEFGWRASLSQLRLTLQFGAYSTFIPIHKSSCDDSWDEVAEDNWTLAQQALAQLLDRLIASEGGGGFGGDSGGGIGGSGGGVVGGGTGGGRVGGGTVICTYSDGQGSSDNPASCPPTYNPELGQ